MDTKILKELGLSENEIKLYLELLKLGETSTGPLIKKSGIASSRVYTSLNSLINRGLVTFITKTIQNTIKQKIPIPFSKMLKKRRNN